MSLDSTAKKVAALGGILSLVGSIAWSGWWLSETLATNETVDNVKEHTRLVESKADYALDIHIQSLRAQIALLKLKPNKDQDDYEQLRWLRSEVVRLRAIRAGKPAGDST